MRICCRNADLRSETSVAFEEETIDVNVLVTVISDVNQVWHSNQRQLTFVVRSADFRREYLWNSMDLHGSKTGCGGGLHQNRGKMLGRVVVGATPMQFLFLPESGKGYVGGVARTLASFAKVQHGPWDVSDGGAGDAATGVACLDRWLVTQAQQAVKWTCLLFLPTGYIDDCHQMGRCHKYWYSMLFSILV